MQPMESTQVYLRAAELSDRIYLHVKNWDFLGRDTVGKQLVRSVDSVAANLVEGDGYESARDAIRFFRYARASGREARHWLARTVPRGLLAPDDEKTYRQELTEVVKMINGLIRHRKTAATSMVRESTAHYDDPFVS